MSRPSPGEAIDSSRQWRKWSRVVPGVRCDLRSAQEPGQFEKHTATGWFRRTDAAFPIDCDSSPRVATCHEAAGLVAAIVLVVVGIAMFMYHRWSCDRSGE